MQRFLAQRLVSLFATLFTISVAIFVMVRLLPGNIIDVLFFGDTTATPAEKHTALVQLGMTGSWWHQYWHWIGNIVLHGDFGRSYRSQEPISQILGHGMHITGELVLLAILIAVVVGVPLGVISAVRRGSAIDYASRVAGTVGISLPSFWLATLFLILTSRVFGWIPPLSYVSFTSNPVKNLTQFIFPALSISVFTLALSMRMVRANMFEVLSLDYVRTARAKGVPRRTVLIKHALRNALVPAVTVVGFEIGGLIGASAIVETIFNLPGLGYTFLQAIQFRDYPIIQSTVMFIALIFVVVNLLVDLLYGFLDPRIAIS